jgi:hypothetical protein
VHSKSKGVLVWKDSRIKNSCIARYVCDMRRMSRAMYNILYVACYIRLDLFHKKTYFSRLRLMHTEAQAQALAHTTSTLLYYQGYRLVSLSAMVHTLNTDCYQTSHANISEHTADSAELD